MRIAENVRKELRKPLGRLQKDFAGIRRLSRSHRIISVGDVCTLGLLAMGVRPHLAVYDHRFMRRRLDKDMVRILAMQFRKPKRYSNPAGTLSARIIADAKGLIARGGGVLIDGEEDLTALAFVMAGGKKDIIIYGQPHEGMVLVVPGARIKKRVRGWLAASGALGHEVKGH